jgi:hypothetical protein
MAGLADAGCRRAGAHCLHDRQPPTQRADTVDHRAHRPRPRPGSRRRGDARLARPARAEQAEQVHRTRRTHGRSPTARQDHPAARSAGRPDQARPARGPDAVRQVHGVVGSGAHDRRCHRVRPRVPRRDSTDRSGRSRRQHGSRALASGHGRAVGGGAHRRRPGPHHRLPLRRGARLDVRPLCRLRRSCPWLGSGHRHRPALRPPRDLVAEVDAFPRQLLKPEMRDGDTFAAETQPPPAASPLERLVAFSGRQLPDKETKP